MRRWFRLVMMLPILSACSPVAVLNTLAPASGTIERSIAYAAGERHSLDIYRAERANAPVVVFVYGGGWKEGDKAQYKFVAASLAARGFVTVVPDYRLYPTVRFPVFLQDAAAAVAWVKGNIARYGGDPNRIFLMGHSAGAHIVAMLTLDPQWLQADGVNVDRDIAGTIALAGPYDFLPLHDPVLEDIFAPAGDLRLTQPITFARGNAPPMFLAAGDKDVTVRPLNTQHLADAIRHDGGQVETRFYPGIGHEVILGSFAGILRWFAPVLADVTGFINAHAARHDASLSGPDHRRDKPG